MILLGVMKQALVCIWYTFLYNTLVFPIDFSDNQLVGYTNSHMIAFTPTFTPTLHYEYYMDTMLEHSHTSFSIVLYFY